MLAEIYREEWGLDAMLDSQVLRETQAIFGKAIEKGVPRSTPHRTAFKQRLKTSTDVFSVFRVHRQAEDIAAHLTDEHGNRRSFGEWAERVQPYLNHQNRAWLQTEYSTAIRRAHDEADWVRFREDADIYPNLEWVPSTSAQPGADHKVFWGTVLPIGDEFWTEHRPGDRWNCKCSLRQTDKAPTATPRVSGKQHEPQAGLRTKPGREEVFSDDHAYFPSDCRMCMFARGLSRLRAKLSSKNRPLSSDGSCLHCEQRIKCMQKEKEAREKKAYKTAEKALKEQKKIIDPFKGVDVIDEKYVTGSLKVLRRSLNDVMEHCNPRNIDFLEWLSDFTPEAMKGWTYQGWAENRPIQPDGKGYDPKDPSKKKHPETEFFLYYSKEINGKTYWANVKMHYHYKSEVLYTIEEIQPSDMIRTLPQKK